MPPALRGQAKELGDGLREKRNRRAAFPGCQLPALSSAGPTANPPRGWKAPPTGRQECLPHDLAGLEEECKAVERAARESLPKVESIEDAVYDLKAVNSNHVSEEDTRTPAQLLNFIAKKGREADTALARLHTLIS
jgi:hypothetical protein